MADTTNPARWDQRFVRRQEQNYDVKNDYGAKGDGATTDTTTVQAAIDAAEGAGGGVVFIPLGTYKVGNLTVDGVSIEGPGTLSLTGAATITVTNTANNKFHIGGVRITGSTATALTLNNVTNLDIVEVKMDTLTYGIIGDGCSNIRIRDCFLDTISYSGIYLYRNCHDILIQGNQLHDVATAGTNTKGIGFAGYWGGSFVPCYNIQIMDNILNESGKLAIELWGSVSKAMVVGNIVNGVGQASGFGISLDTCTECICSNNKVIEGSKSISWGLELAASSHNVVEGNLLDGASYGIACTASGSHENLIDTNIIMNTSEEAIRLSGYNNMAAGNKIYGATGKLLHNFGGGGNMFIGNMGKTTASTAGFCLLNDNGTCVSKDNDLVSASNICLQSNNQTQVTFTADATGDTITTSSISYFSTGDIITVSSTGSLPSPLAVATNYYIILTDVDGTFKLASSRSNAGIGTTIDLTDAGTGVHTLTRRAVVLVRGGDRYNNGKGYVQEVSNGYILHEEIGYVGRDRNADLLSNENFIPFWSSGITQKKYSARTDTQATVTFKFLQASGSQPALSAFVFWNGRLDNVPKGGLFLLAWGTYNDYDVNPTTAQMGDVVTFDAVAYEAVTGYPYWDVHFPVNAELTFSISLHGYDADTLLIDMTTS